MNCYYCGTELIHKVIIVSIMMMSIEIFMTWLHNLKCPRCGATVETYRRPIHVISKLHTAREKDAS